jgi:hypothetical protein
MKITFGRDGLGFSGRRFDFPADDSGPNTKDAPAAAPLTNFRRVSFMRAYYYAMNESKQRQQMEKGKW